MLVEVTEYVLFLGWNQPKYWWHCWRSGRWKFRGY